MKKNIRLNKQIIKALSIGISAGMLLQPVSAYAAENEGAEPEPSTSGAEGTTTATATSVDETAYVEAEGVAQDADEEVGNAVQAYKDAVAAVTEDVSANSDAEVWTAVTDLEQAIADNESALGKDCENAEQTIKDMYDKADEIADWAVSANNLGNTVNADVSAGEAAADKAEKLAEDTNEAIDLLAEDVSANINAINNTTSYDVAKTYYDAVLNDVSAADIIIEQAEKDYASIEQEYETAKADYEKKNAAYVAAVQAYEVAKSEFEALRAEAISGNDSEVGDALYRLAILKEKADKLGEVAGDASATYMEKSAGYIAIANNEKAVLNAESDGVLTEDEWNNVLDPLFEAIIKYYYIPDIVGGTVDADFSCTWDKTRNNQKLNYCVVTYKKGEQVVEETFNYVLSKKDNTGVGFIIFKKGKKADNAALGKKENIVLAEYDNPDGEADYFFNYKPKNLNEDQKKATKAFRDAIDKDPQVKAAYEELLSKLSTADRQYVDAEAKVRELEKAIKELALDEDSITKVNELRRDLVKAEQRLQDAKDKRDEIKEKIEDIVLPEPTPTPEPGPTPGPTPEPEPEPTPAPAAPVLFTAPAPAAPVLELEEEDTPLVEAPQDVQAEDEIEVTDDQTALAAAPITVSDDTTPLASMPEETEMSWWWLLIILVLGATGAEMYRRHMAKKKAAEINTTDVK